MDGVNIKGKGEMLVYLLKGYKDIPQNQMFDFGFPLVNENIL
jgi:hypothetical protein